MKLSKAVLVLAAMLAFLPALAVGDTVYTVTVNGGTRESPILLDSVANVTVESGGSATTKAFSEVYGDFASGAGVFRKRGSGWLKSSANMATFTGEIRVEEGAFIVDATGSMGDEIGFLKADLKDIIDLVGQQCTAKLRTGTVFYRDEGDEYITRDSKFTEDYRETIKFIGKQDAQGGGDWEEAVDEALKKGLDLGWDTHVKSRVAFMLLDAPPHHTDAILASCQKSIELYAKMGIKIIPVSASGIDKGTEYLLRSFAMGTNGTYVFITNHSGVGNEHIEATVGEYQVEKLKDLIARLIIAYAK